MGRSRQDYGFSFRFMVRLVEDSAISATGSLNEHVSLSSGCRWPVLQDVLHGRKVAPGPQSHSQLRGMQSSAAEV